MRFIVELIVGVALAAIVTAAIMVTMFYFGPWADPPGMTNCGGCWRPRRSCSRLDDGGHADELLD